MPHKEHSNIVHDPPIRDASELPAHKAGAPGLRYVFLEQSLVSDANIYQIVRAVRNLEEIPNEYVDIHMHNVDSTFLFIGQNDDLTGLQAEVLLGDQCIIVDSPASVFIPAGLSHSYRLVKGSGYFINTVLAGRYAESITT